LTIIPLSLIMLGLGLVGGLLNAFFSDNGFVLPRTEHVGGLTVVRPGALMNMLIGAIAAVVFWGLYGPFAEVDVIGPPNRPDPTFGATLSQLFTSIVVGIGGQEY
jgi:hypothetical protein